MEGGLKTTAFDKVGPRTLEIQHCYHLDLDLEGRRWFLNLVSQMGFSSASVCEFPSHFFTVGENGLDPPKSKSSAQQNASYKSLKLDLEGRRWMVPLPRPRTGLSYHTPISFTYPFKEFLIFTVSVSSRILLLISKRIMVVAA